MMRPKPFLEGTADGNRWRAAPTFHRYHLPAHDPDGMSYPPPSTGVQDNIKGATAREMKTTNTITMKAVRNSPKLNLQPLFATRYATFCRQAEELEKYSLPFMKALGFGDDISTFLDHCLLSPQELFSSYAKRAIEAKEIDKGGNKYNMIEARKRYKAIEQSTNAAAHFKKRYFDFREYRAALRITKNGEISVNLDVFSSIYEANTSEHAERLYKELQEAAHAINGIFAFSLTWADLQNYFYINGGKLTARTIEQTPDKYKRISDGTKKDAKPPKGRTAATLTPTKQTPKT